MNKELLTLKSEISELRTEFKKVEDLSANPEKATTIEDKFSEIESTHTHNITYFYEALQTVDTKQLSTNKDLEILKNQCNDRSTRLDVIQFQLQKVKDSTPVYRPDLITLDSKQNIKMLDIWSILFFFRLSSIFLGLLSIFFFNWGRLSFSCSF